MPSSRPAKARSSFVGEVVEDRLLRDVGGGGDLGDGDRVEAAFGEQAAGRGGDRLAGGALLARAEALVRCCLT